MDTKRKSRCQQFISKYQEFQSENYELEADQLFNMTLEAVKQSTTHVAEEQVESGDTSLSASFKNAFNEKRRPSSRPKINIADIVKDD